MEGIGASDTKSTFRTTTESTGAVPYTLVSEVAIKADHQNLVMLSAEEMQYQGIAQQLERENNVSTVTAVYSEHTKEGTFYQTVPEYMYIVYSSYISLIFLLGLSQNAVTLYVFMKEKCLRKVHNVFIIGLALNDVCMCLFGTWMVIFSSIYHRWIFGYAGCVYYGFATTLLGITQISLLATIALDRYLIIVCPARHKITLHKAVVMVLCCYGYGFFWAVLPAMGWSSYQLEGIRLRCAINWRSKTPSDLSYAMSILVLAWVVPLAVILFSYGGICSLMFRERDTPFRTTMRRIASDRRRSRRDQRVAVTVLLMIGAFFLSWTPYSIVTLIVAFGRTEYVPISVTMVPTLMAKSSILWNPMIYVARHTDFRKACFRQIPCIFWLKKALKTSSSPVSTSVKVTPGQL